MTTVISLIPLASKASICHSTIGLPRTGNRHFGVFSVNGSRRRPCPALRIIALTGFFGLLPVIFVKVKVHKFIALNPGAQVPFLGPVGVAVFLKRYRKNGKHSKCKRPD